MTFEEWTNEYHEALAGMIGGDFTADDSRMDGEDESRRAQFERGEDATLVAGEVFDDAC